MQTALIIAIYTEIFTLLWVLYLRSDRKQLREFLDQARADRSKAWEEISKLHAERIRDIHRTTDRLNVMTDRLRAANDAHFANNSTKEN